MLYLNLIYIALFSYLLGSFPTALLVVKLLTGKDVRSGGSGNMGALNALRIVKKEKKLSLAFSAFLIVWLADMGKAVLAVVLANELFPQHFILTTTLAVFFAILGHNYPIFLKFKGGRGAASLMGVLLYFNWKVFVIWLAVIFLFMVLTELAFRIIFRRKIDKKMVVAAVSEQIMGRLLGETLALVPIYFIDKNLFFPTLAGTILLLIRHKGRLIKQLKIYTR